MEGAWDTMGLKNFKVVELTELRKGRIKLKTQTPATLGKMRQSIQRTGQVSVLAVREIKEREKTVYEIIDGGDRYDIYKDLKYSDVMIYDFGVISDAEAREIALQLNSFNFFNEVDAIQVAKVFIELVKNNTPCKLANYLPFTEQEIKELSELLNFDWTQFQVNPNQGGLFGETKSKPISTTLKEEEPPEDTNEVFNIEEEPIPNSEPEQDKILAPTFKSSSNSQSVGLFGTSKIASASESKKEEEKKFEQTDTPPVSSTVIPSSNSDELLSQEILTCKCKATMIYEKKMRVGLKVGEDLKPVWQGLYRCPKCSAYKFGENKIPQTEGE